MKTAKDKDEAWEIQEQYKGAPHGWIQWKGTDVCMDIHCECGCMSHIDNDHVYYVQCPNCKAVYFCNGHIEFIKLEKVPDDCVFEGGL